MVIVLTLDAAGEGCAAGLVVDGVERMERVLAGGRGSAAALPDLVHGLLRDAGLVAPDLIAVTVGPGSFTGVRAALALAHGIGLGAGVPVRGAAVGAAIRAACLAAFPGGMPVWVALDSRRARVFLDIAGVVTAVPLDALPVPDGPVALAGDAAAAVAARLPATYEVRVLPETRARPAGIAGAASGPALPCYVDAPVARPNPALRPAPV